MGRAPSLWKTEEQLKFSRSSYPLNPCAQRQAAETGRALSCEICTQTHCHTQAGFMPHYAQMSANNV